MSERGEERDAQEGKAEKRGKTKVEREVENESMKKS